MQNCLSHYGSLLSESELAVIFRQSCMPYIREFGTSRAMGIAEVSRPYLDLEDGLGTDRPYTKIEDNRFIAFHDPAYGQFETPGGSNPNTCNKFRVNVHIHDAEKAWPIVARILNRPDSPFSVWKFSPENPYRVGAGNTRTRFGGQFTLYSLTNKEVSDSRFNEENIARFLKEINTGLTNHAIRPGTMPDGDIEIPGLPYSGYRYDLDRQGKHYEPAYEVTPERRQEYYNQPRYRRVCELVNNASR